MKEVEAEALARMNQECLTALEEQILARHSIYKVKRQCPVCAEMINSYDASPNGDYDYQDSGMESNQACPKCSTPLVRAVPIFAWQPDWWVVDEKRLPKGTFTVKLDGRKVSVQVGR